MFEKPSITSVDVSPLPARAGVVTLTVSGTDFNPSTAQLVITGPANSQTLQPASIRSVANSSLSDKNTTQLVGEVELAAAGTYSVAVQNGVGVTSNSVELTLDTATLHARLVSFVARLKAVLGTHVPGGSSTLSPDDQKDLLALFSEADNLLDEYGPYPRVYGDSVAVPVPTVYPRQAMRNDGTRITINSPEEEADFAKLVIPPLPPPAAFKPMRPDVTVSNPADEAKAKADGFTVRLPDPVPGQVPDTSLSKPSQRRQ